MTIASKIQPLADRVVIKRLDAEEKTKSGIIIPGTANEKPQQGEVIAVGPGKWNEDGDERLALEVKIGDKVLFPSYISNTSEFKIDGQDVLIVSEDNIIAILK